MKKAALIIAAAVLVGCGVAKSRADRKALRQEFSVAHDVILHKGKPFAKLQAMTWSLDGGELVKEMNFKLLDKEDLRLIGGMIDFLSERHQGDEIEVEFDVPTGSDQFKL